MTKFSDDLKQSLEEALAYARGEDVPGMVVHPRKEGERLTSPSRHSREDGSPDEPRSGSED